MHNSKKLQHIIVTLVEPDTTCTCNLVCKSYVTTICKWYVMIHIIIFDIEALFKT